jgi:hypothetical protein
VSELANVPNVRRLFLSFAGRQNKNLIKFALSVIFLALHLTVKCTVLKISTIRQMFYIPCYQLAFIHFQSISYQFCSASCVRTDTLFDKFWSCGWLLSDLAMCVAVKGWHYLIAYFLSLCLNASFPPSKISQTCSFIPC